MATALGLVSSVRLLSALSPVLLLPFSVDHFWWFWWLLCSKFSLKIFFGRQAQETAVQIISFFLEPAIETPKSTTQQSGKILINTAVSTLKVKHFASLMHQIYLMSLFLKCIIYSGYLQSLWKEPWHRGLKDLRSGFLGLLGWCTLYKSLPDFSLCTNPRDSWLWNRIRSAGNYLWSTLESRNEV